MRGGPAPSDDRRMNAITASPDATPVTVAGGGGLGLHVREWGRADGPPILLIHGWSQNHLCWAKQYGSALADEFRLVAFDLRDRTLTWIGVGNVDAMLFHANGDGSQRRERAVLRGGVIGYQLPALKAEVLPLHRSDTVILTTDGVEPRYSDNLVLHGTPQAVADEIMAGHGRATDDALVLVARYQGQRS